MEEKARIYNVPASYPADEVPKALLFLWGDSVKDLVSQAEKVHNQGRRIVRIKYYGNEENLSLLAEIPETVVLELFQTQKETLIKNHPFLKKRIIIAHPDSGQDPLLFIKAITPMGIAVDLSARLPELSREDIDSLLNYYLFQKTLINPIEPFHAIMSEFVEKREFDLWKYLDLDWLHSVYLDEQKRVFLNWKELKVESNCLGMVSEPLEIWEKSKRVKEILEFKRNLKEKYPSCITCSYFFLCKGSLAYHYGHCERWCKVFDILYDNYKQIVECARKFSNPQ